MTQPCITGLFSEPLSPVPPPVNETAREIARLNAAAERVLAVMADGQWHDNTELWRPEIGGNAATRRLWELGQRGHVIEKAHVKGPLYRYRLVRP